MPKTHPHLTGRTPFSDLLLITEQMQALESGTPMTIPVERAREIAKAHLSLVPHDDEVAAFLTRLDLAFPPREAGRTRWGGPFWRLWEKLRGSSRPDEFADERLVAFYAVMPPATALLAIIYSVIAITIAPYVPRTLLLTWITSMYAIFALRAALAIRWGRGHDRGYATEATLAYIVMIASTVGNAATLHVLGAHAPATVVPLVYASAYCTFFGSMLITRMFPTLVVVNFVLGATLINVASYRVDPSLVLGGSLFALWTAINAVVQVRNQRITLQRQAALLEERATLSHVLSTLSETSATWLFSLDANLRLENCSDSLAKILDPDRGAPGDAQLLALLAPDGVPPSGGMQFEALRSHLSTHKSVQQLEVKVNAGRTERQWTLWATPQVDDGGRFAGYKGILSDTTTKVRGGATDHGPAAHLPTTREIEAQLEAAIDRASRDRESAAALFIIEWRNVDEVVRTHGINALDEVKFELVTRIREIHGHAILGHMHRERILCLIPAVLDPAEAECDGELLLQELGALFPAYATMPAFAIGGAHTSTADGSLQVLLDHAEAALIDVNLGRGPLVIYSPRSQVLAPLDELARRIERALDLKAASLRYSAIHDPATHNVTGLMASVLWSDEMLASLPGETVAGLMTPEQIDMLFGILRPEALTVLDNTDANLPVFYPASFALSGGARSAANLGRFVAATRIGFVAATQCNPEEAKSLRKLAMARHPIVISQGLAALEPVLASMATGILAAAYDGNGVVPAAEDHPGKPIATGVGTLSATRDVAEAGYARFCGLKATSDLPATKIIKAISVFNRGSISGVA